MSASHFNLGIWKLTVFSFALGNIRFRNQPVSESFGFFSSLLSNPVVFFCYCSGIWVRLSSRSPGVAACLR